MINYLLLALIIFSGYLTKLPKKRIFDLPKSFLFVVLESFLSILLFGLILFIIFKSPISYLLQGNIGSLFILILSIAIIIGIIIYWVDVFIIIKFKIKINILNLAEYIIQWALIYITIYQIVFDNVIEKTGLSKITEVNITKPADLMIIILPSLISVWISIILYKIREDHI